MGQGRPSSSKLGYRREFAELLLYAVDLMRLHCFGRIYCEQRESTTLVLKLFQIFSRLVLRISAAKCKIVVTSDAVAVQLRGEGDKFTAMNVMTYTTKSKP